MMLVILKAPLGDLFKIKSEKMKVMMDCYFQNYQFNASSEICRELLVLNRDHWDVWEYSFWILEKDCNSNEHGSVLDCMAFIKTLVDTKNRGPSIAQLKLSKLINEKRKS